MTLVYAALLAVASVALSTRTEVGQLAWREWASTNLANLQDHPVEALVASAFLPQEHPAAWVVLALMGLGGAERALGPARTASLVVGGHLAGTAVSEGIVAYRVQAGLLPEQARHILDVGPSFVVVAGLAAGLAVGSLRTRVVSAICLGGLAPSLFGELGELDVASVGHACAFLIGATGGVALSSPIRWSVLTAILPARLGSSSVPARAGSQAPGLSGLSGSTPCLPSVGDRDASASGDVVVAAGITPETPESF